MVYEKRVRCREQYKTNASGRPLPRAGTVVVLGAAIVVLAW